MKGGFNVRRIVSVLFALSVFVSCLGCAFADDFSVRNGISFGMPYEDIRKIEEENGITKRPSEFKGNDGTTYSYSDVSIAGKLGYLDYSFTTDNQLYDIRYLYEEPMKNNIVDTYIEMGQLLTEKYGEPLNTGKSGMLFPIYTSAVNYGKLRGLQDYNEWLVEYEGYAVIIDEIFCQFKNYYTCAIGYKCITLDEMAEIQNAFGEKQNEAQRDL